MESTNAKLNDRLNKLVEINNDRIEGYTKAANETNDGDLKVLFRDMASHSQNFKTELANELSKTGGVPTEGTSVTGKMYRAWMDIKAALTGKNRKTIINSCEFGEDAALETYEDILKSDVIVGEVRELVMKQKEMIGQDHDRIKALRDTVSA